MAQKSMAPLGTQISYALKARGVDVVFGIPGVHNQELYRGLEEAGLRHILARHEQGAGFMADVETGPLASSDRIWNFGICAARCYWRCDWPPQFAEGSDYRRLRISIFPAGIGRCS